MPVRGAGFGLIDSISSPLTDKFARTSRAVDRDRMTLGSSGLGPGDHRGHCPPLARHYIGYRPVCGGPGSGLNQLDSPPQPPGQALVSALCSPNRAPGTPAPMLKPALSIGFRWLWPCV